MGNNLVRRRQVVDDKYTRPQGLYPAKDVDYKKLRKLILEAKLAPCYPGSEECDFEPLEECPICFLYYPTLNRSRCCMKSICTECFLQLKNLNSTHPAQCPFCKTSNYAVEYRGVKSKEERGREQIEEQKVIEAKIRMRQHEVQVEEEIMHKRQETISPQGVMQTQDIQRSRCIGVEGEAVVSSQDSDATPLFSVLQSTQHYQDGMADMDLEDIMVMEAIWLPIQENERQRNSSYERTTPGQCSSPSTALLAGRSDDFDIASVTMTSHAEDWSYHRSEVAEPGTSYASSTESDYGGELLPPPPPPAMSPESVYDSAISDTSVCGSENDQGFSYLLPLPPPPPPLPPYVEPVVPESFEGRVMQAMAVSLSEARASIAARGAAWY